MQPQAADVHWSAVAIIGRVLHVLVIDGYREIAVQLERVIGPQDLLQPIVQGAITDQNAEASGGEIGSGIARQRVSNYGHSYRVIGPPPASSLELRKARRKAYSSAPQAHFA